MIGEDDGPRNFEVVVVGAGPAGSMIAGRLAAAGIEVLLVEATAFDRPRVGEFLSPQARAAVNRSRILGEGWEQEHRFVSEFLSTWGSSDAVARNYIFDPYGPALVLNRATFDRALAEGAVNHGAHLLTRARVRAVARTSDGWKVGIDHNGKSWSVRCAFLAVCSGRAGHLLRALSVKRHRLDRLVCLGMRVLNFRGDNRPSVESYSRGWTYSANLASGELIINLFTEPDTQGHERFSCSADFLLQELANCPTAASRLLGADPIKTADVTFFAADASSTYSIPATGPGWCLAGDSVQTLDPLSSGGIAQALEHGILVSDAVLGSRSVRDIDLSEYAASIQRSHDSYLAARHHFYGLEQRWATIFWRRGEEAHLRFGLQEAVSR
jgi:flavin-dependent dehydrogenase